MKAQIEKDYGFALLTLLWVTSDGKNYLGFGALDFFPKELIECTQIEKNSLSLAQKNGLADMEINFCRVKLSCEEALKLYDSCRSTGKFILPCDSAEILMQEGCDAAPMEFSALPNFTVDKRRNENLCPFLAESWGCCRMHHLLPNAISPQTLMITEYEKPIEWMKERLLWDISMYPELLGSMHLILPNPLIRNMTERLIPDSPNKVAVCFELRCGKTLSDLKGVKFLAIERGVFGIRNVQEQSLSELKNTSFIVTLSGNNTEEFATALYDDDRGLLDWSAFGNFIMGFDIDMRVADAKRRIFIPGSESFYDVTSYKTVDKIKSDTKEDSWGKRFYFQQMKRTEGKYAKKFGQHLFKHGNPDEAEIFIRELIQQAKEKVIIIDPFFSTPELFKYVFGIPSPVDVTIIAGDKLKNKKMLPQIANFQKKFTEYKINVKVMTGKNIIHDRFLIIDDQVWFSGNSINNIGSKASMLIRLPNPQELLDYLDELQTEKSIVSLEAWLKVGLENGKEKS